MASAQVLRKQEHLEAGRRKLEEFRRKKAAEKAKKATSTSQVPVTDGVLSEHQSAETDQVRLANSNGLGTYDSHIEGHLVPPGGVLENRSEQLDTGQRLDFSSSDNAIIESNNEHTSSFSEHLLPNSEEIKDAIYSVSSDGSTSGKENFQNRKWTGNDGFLADHLSAIRETHSSPNYSIHGSDSYLSNSIDAPERSHLVGNSAVSTVVTTETLHGNSVSSLLANRFGNSGHVDKSHTLSSSPVDLGFGFQQRESRFADSEEEKSSVDMSNMGSMNLSSPWMNHSAYVKYNSNAQSSSSHVVASPPAAGRRSRPSFLDSIQISRDPSSSIPLFGATKADSLSSKVYPVDAIGPLASLISTDNSTLIASGDGDKKSDGVNRFNHLSEERQDFLSQKHNEDFAALEQHIEDLTQEKFSLQRAIEASRALAESLASENSALTDSFNQQGSVINQLNLDIEKMQEEIKARLVELEAVQIQYANAQMECNAADERAKLLAAEVIGLEEKALRLRSNELKLERQLETADAEISSHRKKLSSLERDRQDLQSTIDALQEEKKLLQSKLWKVSTTGKSVDVSRMRDNRKDVSTSTEDLDINSMEHASSENIGSPLPGDEALSLEGLAMALPSDQIQTIQNINTLIAELTLEKDQLMQALAAESSQNSNLMDRNKDLSRKLEAQTQRLELLMAQSMSSESNQLRRLDSHISQENSRYADEGDEVVERVLGWIMKLFPGGPSRRRTTKHL